MLDISTTRVRHAVLHVDTQSYVSHLKNIIFRLRYVSDTTNMAWTRAKHGSDARRTRLDTAQIRQEHNLVIFFQLFDGPKKNSKIQKLKFI